MELTINQLKDTQIINSYNFARGCDLVFSEIISLKNYEKFKSKNHNIIFKDDNHLFYKSSSLNIKNGNTIFSNIDLVEPLFNKLKKTKLENITLVTSQTDRSVSSNLYAKKPKNVSKWYSTNVSVKKNDLIPIPYGLSNSYSTKNLFKHDFELMSNKEKSILVYLNFEVNTNYFHRSKLKKILSSQEGFSLEKNSLDLLQYSKNLNTFKYIFCPWGNGFDTHRVWESLYAGGIPIVPEHPTFNSTQNLPVITYKNIKKLNFDYIKSSEKNLKYNYEELNIEFWLKKIRESSSLNSSSYTETIVFDDDLEINRYKRMKKREGRKKFFNTYARKIHFKLAN